MHLQVLKFAMARSITYRILLIAVLNCFCQSRSCPPGGLRNGVVGPVPMKPLSPRELSGRRMVDKLSSATALASWVLPGNGSETYDSSPAVSQTNWWVCPVVLCLPERSSGASAHDQHGHSD